MKEFRTPYLIDVVEVIDNDDINAIVVRGKEFVKVVRCKDCVYWDDWEDERTIGWRYCAMIDTKTEGSWFCADGEKKDGKLNSTDCG